MARLGGGAVTEPTAIGDMLGVPWPDYEERHDRLVAQIHEAGKLTDSQWALVVEHIAYFHDHHPVRIAQELTIKVLYWARNWPERVGPGAVQTTYPCSCGGGGLVWAVDATEGDPERDMRPCGNCNPIAFARWRARRAPWEFGVDERPTHLHCVNTRACPDCRQILSEASRDTLDLDGAPV